MWDLTTAPAVGVAYAGYVPGYVDHCPGEADYVEVPFELLRHDPEVAKLGQKIPIVLHCASLSIAGTSLCPAETLRQVGHWAKSTGTPWIGEHLAFITADREEGGVYAEPVAPGEPYNIGYTVSPPMNAKTAARALKHLRHYGPRFDVPVLIENSPLYLRMPSSNMAQSAFMSEILGQCEAGLLLDLAHLVISAETMGFDAETELEKYPLGSLVEVHISGVDHQEDGVWDNHAGRAPELVYRLLEQTMRRARPRAVTLEYNWSVRFPQSVLREEIARVRETCAVCA
jgi:uncharacterized protein